MSQKDNNIVIIGGYGFLGQHLSHSLIETLYSNVYIVGRDHVEHYSRSDSTIKRISSSNIEEVLNKAEIVIYLAWDSTPFSSLQDRQASHNLAVLKKHINLLILSRLDKFIFISTAGAIYKSEKESVFSELSEFTMSSPYAKEKIAAENIILEKLGGICSIYTLRPTNVYGPGQCLKKGMGIIPRLFDALNSNNKITLYESDTSMRDYLYISDFTSAVLLFISKDFSPGVYNISYGESTSLKKLIGHFNNINQSYISYEIQLKINSNSSRVSSNKLQNISNWKPMFNIATGLELTRKWHNL